MNKYEEALNELVDINYNGEDAQDIMEQARDILQELIERATPKKLNSIDVYVKCPNCSNDEIRDIDNYCPNCGQALDWS